MRTVPPGSTRQTQIRIAAHHADDSVVRPRLSYALHTGNLSAVNSHSIANLVRRFYEGWNNGRSTSQTWSPKTS
jgi:hypothetical protein